MKEITFVGACSWHGNFIVRNRVNNYFTFISRKYAFRHSLVKSGFKGPEKFTLLQKISLINECNAQRYPRLSFL